MILSYRNLLPQRISAMSTSRKTLLALCATVVVGFLIWWAGIDAPKKEISIERQFGRITTTNEVLLFCYLLYYKWNGRVQESPWWIILKSSKLGGEWRVIGFRGVRALEDLETKGRDEFLKHSQKFDLRWAYESKWRRAARPPGGPPGMPGCPTHGLLCLALLSSQQHCGVLLNVRRKRRRKENNEMKIILLFSLFLIANLTTVNAQKKQDLDSRVSRLEKTIDSLGAQLRFSYVRYGDSDIEISGIRARLALEMNRNFVYFATVNEGDTDSKDGRGCQRVFRFYGYHSASYFADRYGDDRAGWLRLVRQHIKIITQIIQGGRSELLHDSEGYTYYPHRVIITFLDNSKPDEVLIEADSHLKSLKVRIEGILQEVGWD